MATSKVQYHSSNVFDTKPIFIANTGANYNAITLTLSTVARGAIFLFGAVGSAYTVTIDANNKTVSVKVGTGMILTALMALTSGEGHWTLSNL